LSLAARIRRALARALAGARALVEEHALVDDVERVALTQLLMSNRRVDVEASDREDLVM
jgi:hypothetical protein